MSDLRAVMPKPTNASLPFWEACDREELILPVCNACHHTFYFPRIHCPVCASRDLSWRRASGRAKVFTYTHVAVSFHGPDWDSQLPYTVVIVDLEEGPRMVSRLIGPGRESVKTGDAVSVTFPHVEERKLPFFQIDPTP